MYRLSYTQVSKQNRNRIEAELDFSFAQIKKKQYFFRRIVRLRMDWISGISARYCSCWVTAVTACQCRYPYCLPEVFLRVWRRVSACRIWIRLRVSKAAERQPPRWCRCCPWHSIWGSLCRRWSCRRWRNGGSPICRRVLSPWAVYWACCCCCKSFSPAVSSRCRRRDSSLFIHVARRCKMTCMCPKWWKWVIFAVLIITYLWRKCKNNAEKFGFGTILYYLCGAWENIESPSTGLCHLFKRPATDSRYTRDRLSAKLW